jgi:hypothetical protein
MKGDVESKPGPSMLFKFLLSEPRSFAALDHKKPFGIVGFRLSLKIRA